MKIKNYQDWTVKGWRRLQLTSGFCIILFLIYMDYPLWHILILTLLIGVLVVATHIRQLAMGMILKSLQSMSKAVIDDPYQPKNFDKDLPN